MKGFTIALIAILLFGGVAAVAYQAGIAAGAATAAGGAAAVTAYPYLWHPGFFGFGFFGFLFPLLFLFLIFGLARAAFGGPRWYGGYGYRGGGPRMFDEWHREMHEREKSAGPEKADH
jgi:hypothetical protein